MSTHPGAPSVGSAKPRQHARGWHVSRAVWVPSQPRWRGRPRHGCSSSWGSRRLVRAALAVQVASAWILPDEVVYSDLAKSIANGRLPRGPRCPRARMGSRLSGAHRPGVGSLRRPGARLPRRAHDQRFPDVARGGARVLPRAHVRLAGASVVVAAMTVLVPSMSYSGVLMTENACYPAFLLAVLLIARARAIADAGEPGARAPRARARRL